MAARQRLTARQRAELLWMRHTRPTAEVGRDASVDNARLGGANSANRRVKPLADAGGVMQRVQRELRDRDDAHWIRHFGEHLGRLYEPAERAPSDLDELVKAVAERLSQNGA